MKNEGRRNEGKVDWITIGLDWITIGLRLDRMGMDWNGIGLRCDGLFRISFYSPFST